MVLQKPWVLQLYFHQNQWVSQSCFLWLFPSHRLNFFYKTISVSIFCKAKKVSECRIVCVLQKWCLNSLKLTFKTFWSFDLTMGVRAAWNKSQKPLIVCTAGLFAWNLTSLTLCHYVIGLFTECKQTTNSCEQLFLCGEHCMTSKKQLRRRQPLRSHYLFPWEWLFKRGWTATGFQCFQ